MRRGKLGGSPFGGLHLPGGRIIVYWLRGEVIEFFNGEPRTMPEYLEIGTLTVSGNPGDRTYRVSGVGNYRHFGQAARALLKRWQREQKLINDYLQVLWSLGGTNDYRRVVG